MYQRYHARPKAPKPTPAAKSPSFLQGILPKADQGDTLVLLILLLLLMEGNEDSKGLILTLLIFLFLR